MVSNYLKYSLLVSLFTGTHNEKGSTFFLTEILIAKIAILLLYLYESMKTNSIFWFLVQKSPILFLLWKIICRIFFNLVLIQQDLQITYF